MLQTAPKSQWLTTTKVCFSLLLHVLCGLAACLYSGNQTARPTLPAPGAAGAEGGGQGLARALRASTQQPVPSNPVPLARWAGCLSHEEGHKHLGMRTGSVTTLSAQDIARHAEISQSVMKTRRLSVKWVSNSTGLTGSVRVRRGNNITGPGPIAQQTAATGGFPRE